MEACADYLVSDWASMPGRWHELFGKQGPIHLEIGCGKGAFVTQMAAAHPDVLFVAVERVPSVLLLAMERAARMELRNVRFLSIDAALLGDVFARDEVACLYLNFSDPWLPKKHHKRRLSHGRMLAVYDRFLQPGGQIEMKTDSAPLFSFSMCSFSQFGYPLYDVTFDLHHTDTENIMTEYETMFFEQGLPIYRAVAKKEPPRAFSALGTPEK